MLPIKNENEVFSIILDEHGKTPVRTPDEQKMLRDSEEKLNKSSPDEKRLMFRAAINCTDLLIEVGQSNVELFEPEHKGEQELQNTRVID